jgi:predicted acyltransferase
MPSIAATQVEAAESHRIPSVDAFRGLAVAGMILVNSPGNDRPYPWIAHAPWNGCTAADWVFPAFLFIMGVSSVISFRKRLGQGEPHGNILRHVFLRSAVIFGVGLISSAIMWGASGVFRPMGVFQRIALCYLGATFVFLRTPMRGQKWVVASILILYWAILERLALPHHGPGDLSPQFNWASYLDRLILGRHLLHPLYDPEGLLSTLPAIATTLLGVITGERLVDRAPAQVKASRFMAWGAALTIGGALWSPWFPINKNLWTSSFVLYTGGISLAAFGAFHALYEVLHRARLARPLLVFGRNPLASYFLSEMFYGLQEFIPARMPDGSLGDVKRWLCVELFGRLSAPQAALAYAFAYLLLCWLAMDFLYRRRIFIKV